LALAWEVGADDEAAAPLHVTLAKVRRQARLGVLFDAYWDDRFCRRVIAAMGTPNDSISAPGNCVSTPLAANPNGWRIGSPRLTTRRFDARCRGMVGCG
jgi:maltose alpha-D-glucosyltransferase / alpha-amylase